MRWLSSSLIWYHDHHAVRYLVVTYPPIAVYKASVERVFGVHGESRLGDDLRLWYDERLRHRCRSGIFSMFKRFRRLPQE